MGKRMEKNCPCQGGTLVRFVQPIILAALEEDSYHGYVLLQKIADTQIWARESPDPSGVYRILRNMENRGLIASRIERESGGGIGKKVFFITPEGSECRQNWLSTLRQYQEDLLEVVALLEKCGEGKEN